MGSNFKRNWMVDVIIVTYNGMKWIDKCLKSIYRQEIISRIIVVDNGSQDGTINYIKDNYPSITVIANSENYGFGFSNNQGLNLALQKGTEYAFLLNQDAWIEDHAIDKLVAIHKRNAEYGILSPAHLRGDGKAMDMKFAAFIAQSENYNLISDLYLHRNEMKEVYPVQFVNAAAWLISKKCFHEVGGFAPIYHHYGEDMDYANRVLYHGFKIGFCPDAIIRHDRVNVIDLPDVYMPSYLKIKKVWHLIYLTNINHSFFIRFIKLLVISAGNCLNEVFHLNLKTAWTYMKEVGVLLSLFPKVWANNRKTKEKGPSFLTRDFI